MNAIELMTKKSEEYLQSIKRSCNEKVWNSNFEDRNFIAQCFDDIHNEVMREFHGEDYYNPTNWASDEVGADYEATCDIRSDFTDTAYLYVLEQKEAVDVESWDK